MSVKSLQFSVFIFGLLQGSNIWAEIESTQMSDFSDAAATLYYSDVITTSTFEKRHEPLENGYLNSPRPANSYRLIGGAEKSVCKEVLSIFNEPGQYRGNDAMYWGLENSGLITWESIDLRPITLGSEALRSFGIGVEHASIDMDGDGIDEHAYRVGRAVSSHQYQVLGIFEAELRAPELEHYKAMCNRFDRKEHCERESSQISYLLGAAPGERPQKEWMSTKSDMAALALSDKRSRKMVFPKDKNRAARNIAYGTQAYWNLYRISSGVVAISAPTLNFALPEYLVFSPRQNDRAVLQCVIAPSVWRK